MSAKIFVRYLLWIEDDYGFKREAGARLHKGESAKVFPRECMDAQGNLIFTFDTEEAAKKAAQKLESYINASNPKKKKP